MGSVDYLLNGHNNTSHIIKTFKNRRVSLSNF